MNSSHQPPTCFFFVVGFFFFLLILPSTVKCPLKWWGEKPLPLDFWMLPFNQFELRFAQLEPAGRSAADPHRFPSHSQSWGYWEMFSKSHQLCDDDSSGQTE